MKMFSKKVLGVICICAFLASGGLVYAATIFQQNIVWTYMAPSFTVNGASATSSDINLGPIEAGTYTRTFVVVNNGNGPITVSATATVTGATATFNKATTDLLQVNGQETLTLTLVVTGQGSCTVNFAKV